MKIPERVSIAVAKLLANLCGCDAVRGKNEPEWLKWKREGPEPAYWWATNPKTGELTKVYRSYKDYGND